MGKFEIDGRIEDYPTTSSVNDFRDYLVAVDEDGNECLMVDDCRTVLVCAGSGEYLTSDDTEYSLDEYDNEKVLIGDRDGNVYSIEYANENLVRCDCCGFWSEYGDGVDTDYDEHFCDYCISHDYVIKCSECGEYHQESYYRSQGATGEDEGGYDMYLCENCVLDYATCEGCGCFVKREEAEYRDGEYWCSDCFDARFNKDIHSYHFDGDETDYGMEHLGEESKYKDPLMGAEVEIDKKPKDVKPNEDRDMHAREIRKAIGENHIVCCDDGSLKYGFEVISCPASLKHHRYSLDWTRGFLKALEFGYRGHDVGTCGVHVHVDRRFFYKSMLTSEEVEGAMFIVLKNNVDWIKRFSRRFEYSHCEINGTQDDTERIKDMDKYDKRWTKDARYDAKKDRYQAINFSRSDTIEFRIFRGTLNIKTFYAILECVDIYARIIRECGSLEDAMSVDFDMFVYYAETYKYKYFLDYCKNIGLIDNDETGF